MKTDLDKKFEEAYIISSTTHKKIPPDVMLQIYAYYKQASIGNNYKEPSANIELKNAFKLNAWFQVNHLTVEEAKIEYIKLVNKHLK